MDSRVDGQRVAVRAEGKRAAALRQAVLKHAFFGGLVSQDPSDEPAAELLARIADLDAAERELTNARAGLSKTKPLAQVMKEHGMQPPTQRRTRTPRGV